jgi:hypothetical protein
MSAYSGAAGRIRPESRAHLRLKRGNLRGLALHVMACKSLWPEATFSANQMRKAVAGSAVLPRIRRFAAVAQW